MRVNLNVVAIVIVLASFASICYSLDIKALDALNKLVSKL